MVTTEVFMDKSTNEWKEIPEWHNIVAWGWTAKKVEKNVHKGSMVLVEGKIKTRKWKDKNDQDRWTTEIAADVVVSLDKSSREGAGPEIEGRQQGDYMNTGPQSKSDFPDKESQAPPEVQINDVPYDEGDPF
jgi:single-strand DNA-binding protein